MAEKQIRKFEFETKSLPVLKPASTKNHHRELENSVSWENMTQGFERDKKQNLVIRLIEYFKEN